MEVTTFTEYMYLAIHMAMVFYWAKFICKFKFRSMDDKTWWFSMFTTLMIFDSLPTLIIVAIGPILVMAFYCFFTVAKMYAVHDGRVPARW